MSYIMTIHLLEISSDIVVFEAVSSKINILLQCLGNDRFFQRPVELLTNSSNN